MYEDGRSSTPIVARYDRAVVFRKEAGAKVLLLVGDIVKSLLSYPTSVILFQTRNHTLIHLEISTHNSPVFLNLSRAE